MTRWAAIPSTRRAQPELVENVRWIESRVAFATLHVIGSNNGLAPVDRDREHGTDPRADGRGRGPRSQRHVAWIDETFDAATERDSMGVVLAMQADTLAPAPASAQQAIVDRIAARTAAFDGQCSSSRATPTPTWSTTRSGSPNFTRIVVHGETLPFEYLRLTIDPRSERLFTWAHVRSSLNAVRGAFCAAHTLTP